MPFRGADGGPRSPTPPFLPLGTEDCFGVSAVKGPYLRELRDEKADRSIYGFYRDFSDISHQARRGARTDQLRQSARKWRWTNGLVHPFGLPARQSLSSILEFSSFSYGD
jgi:hypothetical protein